ncbi:MAG TPA: mechanosensitive ion channel domain-containing protein [Desulfopila sp.]|nr:mechanosensitive ion channel domain-containing protein [Desulfopila sp.]
MNFSIETLQELAVVYGAKILVAILLLLVGKWLAGKCADILAKIMEKRQVDVTLVKFLRNIVYYMLLVAVLVAAAGELGINTASFLTIIGAASLAIGLALKDSLANFAAGAMLILFRPFRIGDYVIAGGEAGTVEEITIFNTILQTPDNQKKIIPNGSISNSVITNITANPTRRVDLTIGIGYDDDLRRAKDLLEKIVKDDDRILAEPEPAIMVSALGDSAVNIVCRPWVKKEHWWAVHCDLLEKIKLCFDAEGISIPYPQRDVHVYNESDAAEQPEREVP